MRFINHVGSLALHKEPLTVCLSRSLIVAGTAAALTLFAVSSPAKAATYGFQNISGNNASNAAAGESQLRVEVLDAGTGKVSFTFWHDGTDAMSITDIYFDDGALVGIASIENGDGVAFSLGAKPDHLPGGSDLDPAFEVTAGFLADSDSPVQTNGVNPGESVTIIFDLINGKTFEDTIAALDGPLSVGDDLRIGIKVQGFLNGGSESFINGPPRALMPAVPEPGTVAIWGLGLALCGVVSAVRQRKLVA